MGVYRTCHSSQDSSNLQQTEDYEKTLSAVDGQGLTLTFNERNLSSKARPRTYQVEKKTCGFDPQNWATKTTKVPQFNYVVVLLTSQLFELLRGPLL